MTAAMHAARRLQSDVKTAQVRAALTALLASGRDTTLAEIARRAGVSRKFIYSHPDLRAEIEHQALQAATQPGRSRADDPRVTMASLRADAANSRAQTQRQRQQVTALEQRLSEALGQQIAAELPGEQALTIDTVQTLRADLDAAHQQALVLREALDEAREELAAAREINRELVSQHNRSGN